VKHLVLFLIVLALSGTVQPDGWLREDLYESGRKAFISKDCFKAIKLLYAFLEINNARLANHRDLNDLIKRAISQCEQKILESRNIEYRTLPTDKNCFCGSQMSMDAPEILSDRNFSLHRKTINKGNPYGREVSNGINYDVLFSPPNSLNKRKIYLDWNNWLLNLKTIKKENTCGMEIYNNIPRFQLDRNFSLHRKTKKKGNPHGMEVSNLINYEVAPSLDIIYPKQSTIIDYDGLFSPPNSLNNKRKIYLDRSNELLNLKTIKKENPSYGMEIYNDINYGVIPSLEGAYPKNPP
jgi:hypothetical protein